MKEAMTKSQRNAIQATVVKLEDLAEKGRDSEHFKTLGDYETCPLCKEAGMRMGAGGAPWEFEVIRCSAFGWCDFGQGDTPCMAYTPPGRRIDFTRIADLVDNDDPMSIHTFKSWCFAAACDLRARFLEGK